jgi:hypothetical protein
MKTNKEMAKKPPDFNIPNVLGNYDLARPNTLSYLKPLKEWFDANAKDEVINGQLLVSF